MAKKSELPAMIEIETVKELPFIFNDEDFVADHGTWERFSADGEDTIIFTDSNELIVLVCCITYSADDATAKVYTPVL